MVSREIKNVDDLEKTMHESLKSIVPLDLQSEFLEWARDGGYDESYFNRWDSKSRALEELFLSERAEAQQ